MTTNDNEQGKIAAISAKNELLIFKAKEYSSDGFVRCQSKILIPIVIACCYSGGFLVVKLH